MVLTVNTTSSFGGYPTQFSRIQANELANVTAWEAAGGETLVYDATLAKWVNQDERATSAVTVVTDTPAANRTYTTTEILGGLILRDPGANRTDVMPTAALLVAGFANAVVGGSFKFTIRNTASGAEVITLAAGTGGGTNGTMTIAQANTKEFLVIFTNVTAAAEAYTVYSLGSAVA